jgi:glutamate-1-semialdehyde 2,1-aminomutase
MIRNQSITYCNGPFVSKATGKKYLDLTMGLGSLLFGHARREITEALQDQVDTGWHLGDEGGVVTEWIKLIKQLTPCAEMIRPTASATEANQLAIRIARCVTGREWIIRFDGHYHGCFDEGLADGASAADKGFHPLAASKLLVLDEADRERVNDFIATERVAAVVLEPGGGAGGLLPYDQSRLLELRKITSKCGTVLIFDESMTGFRYAPGGVQQISGVKPDMCILSKILTGGLPGAAIAGRGIYLTRVSNEPTLEFDGQTPYSSTFAGHPLTAAAGAASLRLAESGEVQIAAADNAQKICDLLNVTAAELDVDWRAFVTSSVIHHVTGIESRHVPAAPSRVCAQLVRSNWRRQRIFHEAFDECGVLLHPMHAWISSAHDERALDFLRDAAPRALRIARGADRKYLADD